MSTSRTSDKSSITETAQAYLKRSAVSAIAFVRKYKEDIFYRTGWNVVLLQIGFTALLLAVVWISLNFLYDDILTELITSIAQAVKSGVPDSLDSVAIAANLEYQKSRSIVLSGTAVLIAAAIFGWLITRIALTPTRNALQSQKQFVGNIAHELRTPLSIIKTNTEVALFDPKLSQNLKETLDSNVEELDRISDIINNLLSMNALLRPEKADFKNVDLKAVVDHAIQSLDDLADHKNIGVRVQTTGGTLVWGNSSGLDQIVMNVLKNAINYSSAGSYVNISIKPAGPVIALTIADTGAGIEDKDLKRIFEPFYRGDASRNRKSGGSGLGLAIVQELVKLHKGRIRIESEPGAGTKVIVTLPHGKQERKSETARVKIA